VGKGWKNISVEKYCISSCNTSYLICLIAGVYVQQSTMILVHHPLHSTRSIGNSQTISVYKNHQWIESGRVPLHNYQSYEDGSKPVGFLFSGEFSPESNLNNCSYNSTQETSKQKKPKKVKARKNLLLSTLSERE